MKLTHSITKLGATLYWVQLNHRKTAMEYIVQVIADAYTREESVSCNDLLLTEFSKTMRDWAIETLIQGAYLREYHIWEKDTKEYFANQLARNNDPRSFPFPKMGDHIEQVKAALDLFSVEITNGILTDIDSMRKKANIAKHEPGLHDSHFVAQSEYHNAVEAIESFWEVLSKNEKY